MAQDKQAVRAYVWRDGFHPPKGVEAEQVANALAELPEPSPENLLLRSKRKQHVLHDEFWSEGDQIWAARGRLDHARRIIGAVCETVVTGGGKTIEVRVVEFIRVNGEERWAMTEQIVCNPVWDEAYLGEIQKLQEQAIAKLQRYRELHRE